MNFISKIKSMFYYYEFLVEKIYKKNSDPLLKILQYVIKKFQKKINKNLLQ